MISFDLAVKLKNAGLQRDPKANDFFVIPDRGLDDRIFVINDVLTNMTIIRGEPALSFQGAPEWALDYLITSEVVWIPRESQIREALTALMERQEGQNNPSPDRLPLVTLILRKDYTTCVINPFGKPMEFESPLAADAYGNAYLNTVMNLADKEDASLQ
jgi:hypothetical protein